MASEMDSSSSEWPEDEVFLGDLDNDIHPIFAKHNFPGADYSVLEPVLRLASQLLLCKRSLTFWHAIFNGKEEKIPDLSEKYETEIYEYHRKEGPLSARDIAITKLELLRLADMVRFCRETPSTRREGLGEPLSGLCCSCLDPNRFEERSWGFHGRGSDISYSEVLYQELIDDLKNNRDETIKGQFNFAALMVHEVAHAATYLKANRDFEDFFEDTVVAEAGYEWEAFVFGDSLTQFRYYDYGQSGVDYSAWADAGYPDVSVSPWPSRRAYGFEKIQPPSSLAQECLPADEVRWLIPVWYIQKLFTKQFWDVELERMGDVFLQPPKELGYIYTYEDSRRELIDSLRGNKNALEREFSMPENCELDWDGNVRQIADWTDWDGFGRLLKINLDDDVVGWTDWCIPTDTNPTYTNSTDEW